MDQTVHPTARTAVPSWAVDNPYLGVLAPRFFAQSAQADWSDLARRVVRMFTVVERRHVSEAEALALADRLHALVHDGAFMPNSPVMMNSEHDSGINLFACHVLAPPVDAQSMEIASRIHDGCGGIGYDLTSVADPVAMTRFIETQTAQRNPTRKRKAHSAVTLHVDHPMVTRFIGMSSALEITHTNVELDAAFFVALERQDRKAVSIWADLCHSIHSNGRPAIAFGEHKSLRSPNGERLILNVCGESLLRENESSLIGSLNAARFVRHGVFDDARFKEAVAMAVHCLDNRSQYEEGDHIIFVGEVKYFSWTGQMSPSSFTRAGSPHCRSPNGRHWHDVSASPIGIRSAVFQSALSLRPPLQSSRGLVAPNSSPSPSSL